MKVTDSRTVKPVTTLGIAPQGQGFKYKGDLYVVVSISHPNLPRERSVVNITESKVIIMGSDTTILPVNIEVHIVD